jgi:hypothetical protein
MNNPVWAQRQLRKVATMATGQMTIDTPMQITLV